MDWKTILTIALGTGLLSALLTTTLTLVWGWWDKRSTNERSATYLAIRLAVILERFAIDCADRIRDQELYDATAGNAGADVSKLPELELFPDEQSWNTLQPDLVARVLTLPNERRLCSSSIATWWECADEADVPAEFKRQCGKAGHMAWVLAHDLRKQYRLHPFDPRATSLDIADKLKRYHDEALRHGNEIGEVEDDGSEWEWPAKAADSTAPTATTKGDASSVGGSRGG